MTQERVTIAFPTVTEKDAAPARRLWIELATRVTTQRVHYRSGDEESAATSIASLFEITRQILADHPAAEAAEFSAVFMLNSVVRPYSSRWHQWIVEERFQNPLVRRQFRKELLQLRRRLAYFQQLFAQLAKKQPPPPEMLLGCFGEFANGSIAIAEESGSGLAEMGGDVEAGIGDQVPFYHPERAATHFASRLDVERAEHSDILARQRALGDPRAHRGRLVNATGLCLSGGGIRSATFCLGVVQELAARGLLAEFDYLSTVSGGGYLGSFISSFLGTDPEALEARLTGQVERDAAANPGLSTSAASPGPTDEKGRREPASANQAALRDGNGSPAALRERIRHCFAPRPGGLESAAIRHLRNNSRYLLHGGLWARIRIAGLLLSGVVTNLLVLLPLPLAAVLLILGLQSLGYWGSSDPLPPSPPPSIVDSTLALKVPIQAQGTTPAEGVLIGSAIVLGSFWLLLPLIQSLSHGKPPASRAAKLQTLWTTLTLLAGLITAAAGILYFVPSLFVSYLQVRTVFDSAKVGVDLEKLVASVAVAMPFIFGPVAVRLAKGRLLKKVATVLFALSGPLLLGFLFLFVGSRALAVEPGHWEWRHLAGVTAGLTLWGWVFLNINTHGPHRYYRDRLCECYLATPSPSSDQQGVVKRRLRALVRGTAPQAAEVGSLQKVPLTALGTTLAAPYHLINATVNLTSSEEQNLRGRDSDFFVFSRRYCGGPICGYVPTEELERLDPHLDLGTAMAISGAAASSNMGVKTLRQFRFLLTLLNVRLGYWLRNPRKGRIDGLFSALAGPGPLYLFSEMIGWMHERGRYLNVSDGGHIENLALYELLRRRCKYIVVVDAGMEPGMECSDLLLAQRYAAIDLGIDLRFDLSDLMLDEKRTSRAYAVFGKILYNPSCPDSDLGWLVYIKLAVIGSEPGYVADYRRKHPDFPHETTGDQIYEEAQFEAYRALGEAAAKSLFDDELTEAFRSAKARELSEKAMRTIDPDNIPIQSIADWFQAMATSLLPEGGDAATLPAFRAEPRRGQAASAGSDSLPPPSNFAA